MKCFRYIALLLSFAFIFTYGFALPCFARGAESVSAAPGGDEITLALLIVSGLLAIASFIAFLISLSSIRNKPSNKGDQK